ncbi:glycosyltransferase [Picrophilus oshimae]|uniref:Glycosyltransferase involved in cell wall bisynthesis n=1 Tax=Picrophilus torridus (strain ATCC 700027 / DSM 9790 / JCM 10055 / NBRC 100828 / KAW 2/3) TaxID=1122961 RepID=A0A8G2FWI0_PICTO|nr:glycosyltransferase [Picrophilus oshimae]SMD30797.1 Glycosyltransferase involved in cell wall bisynthesis [Picrophilus oshimae DSM 9789]
MRAAIIDEFTRIGGGQFLARLIFNKLKEDNINVSLITDSGHPYLDLKAEIIETSYNYKENASLPYIINRVIKTRHDLKKIFKIYKFDLTFNNHPNMFLYNANINILHGFSFLDPFIDEYGNIKNQMAFKLIKYSKIYKIYNNGIFYVNSKYTLSIANKLFPKLDIKPALMKVIYIPVKYKLNNNLINKNIVSIGRINKDKNYELIIDIAKSLLDYKFYIIGAVNKGDEQYYNYLMRIKPKNLEIIPNASDDIKDSILKRCSIYLHANRKENYGISIIEAMSYGLIPVVPMSGGPWMDIIDMGKYGYGYNNADDAVETIKSIDFSIRDKIKSSMERFSYEKFYIDLEELINIVYNK